MEGTTQKDPLAMAMYALAVTPLICHLRSSDPTVSQVWYVIYQSFIPALFGHHSMFAYWERLVCTPILPGLINPCSVAHSCFCDSEQLTAPLVALIVAQCATQTVDRDRVHQLKQCIRKNNRGHQTVVADTLQSDLPPLLNAMLTLPRNLGHLSGLLLCQY